MAEKVGIIGYKGFVGSAFYKVFCADNKYEVAGISRDNYGKMKGMKFDILINCNGNSSKRLAESKPEKDWEMNVSATERFLSDFPSEHYIHLSTVEVYNDKSGQSTTREDVAIDASKLSNYGKSKYAGEQVAKKHRSYLILRLSGMVGETMSKGPAYDIINLQKLFISEKSRYQYMDSADVARITKILVDRGRWGETYNIVGKGNIALAEVAEIVGVTLKETGKEVQVFDISTEKIEKENGEYPTSRDAVVKIAGKKGAISHVSE